MIKKSFHTELLHQSLRDATRKHKTIQVRFLKLLLTGSGAAGKTSFSHLLLNKKFKEYYHRISVVYTSHAVSVNKAVIQSLSSLNEVEWVPLGFYTTTLRL